MFKLEQLYNKVINKLELSAEEALFILNIPNDQLERLYNYANKIKHKFAGDTVHICTIINAKSGQCSENCSFCAQSAHHKSNIEEYPQMSKKEIIKNAQKNISNKASCFSIVTSGKGVLNNNDFDTILSSVNEIKNVEKGASLGLLTKEQAQKLKKAGLTKYHHNLETSESFFPNMCTTHTYNDRIDTLKVAKSVGLDLCCGGIFGLGETLDQRVELAMALKDLNIKSLPLNFVNQIEGTKIYNTVSPITKPEIFKIIAMFRFMFPDAMIGVIGGRELHLGKEQPKIFKAGANGIMVGNYLTTDGNPQETDFKMIEKAGLKIKKPNI